MSDFWQRIFIKIFPVALVIIIALLRHWLITPVTSFQAASIAVLLALYLVAISLLTWWYPNR